MRSIIVAMLLLVVPCVAWADESLKGIACRSVHLGYKGEPGSAFYNEMTIEESAPGTYFMAAGFRDGYFGLQELANGKKLIIFSVWDPTSGDDPKTVPPEKRVKLLKQGDGVRVGRFGGEGTGGQSFHDFTWKTGESYRFLVTTTTDGPDRTAFAAYFYFPETKSWKHLATFSTVTKNKTLGGYYSFVEDFRRNKISTTKLRRASFNNAWVKTTKGDWLELTTARFTADANPVLNIDAGLKADRFFLATGGTIENTTTKLKDTIVRPAQKRAPSDLPPTP